MCSEPNVPSEKEVRADFVALHTRNFDSYQVGRSLTSEQEYYGDQFDRFIAKVQADTLREFAAKDIPAAVEARRTLLAEADRIEEEA